MNGQVLSEIIFVSIYPDLFLQFHGGKSFSQVADKASFILNLNKHVIFSNIKVAIKKELVFRFLFGFTH